MCHHGKFSNMQRTMTTTENITYKIVLGSPVPTDTSSKTPIIKGKGTLKNKKQKYYTVRGSGSSLRLCLLQTSETMPMKSQQYNSPNMSLTKMASMTIPNWLEKSL